MVGGETGFSRCLFEDGYKYIGHAPVPGTNWSMAVAVPATELSEQLFSLPIIYMASSLFFLVIMTIILVIFLGGALVNLRLAASEAVRIANGDLTGNQLPVRTKDEMGQLASVFNAMLSKLKKTTTQLQEKSGDVTSTAKEIRVSAENMAAGAAETASAIDQVASSLERLTENTRHISDSSEQAVCYARESADCISQITSRMEAIQRATSANEQVITGLNQSTEKITRVVEMITKIAGQTNRLALNAAVEAARAGEQGRGFAIIAEEARELSDHSTDAAKQTHDLIIALQQELCKAVQIMNEGSTQVHDDSGVVIEMGGALKKLITSVQDLPGEIGSIAGAIGQIYSEVENMATATRRQIDTMEEVSSTTKSLTALAEQMEQLSKNFKLL